MIYREAQKRLEELAGSFKSVAVIGPRQSGKTTLVKATFPGKVYVSLENPDTRYYATTDPRGFLESLLEGAILDEIQRVPQLFSYLQEILDGTNQKGLFILTGSNNFLLQENISQTLAGRISYLTLLPFSISELQGATIKTDSDNQLLFNGFYPPIYDQKIKPNDWIPNYIRTYIERDVRQIKNINNLLVFEKFMQILAGRTGQELNLSSISVEVGVNLKTIQSWIGILESSFIIYLLKPHYKNFNKTIVKRPKVYFYDVGVVCSFLRISTSVQLETHPLRGAIFETMVVVELLKKLTNKAMQPNIYYWRDKTGHEIDIIIDTPEKLVPVEIKSGKTIATDWFKSIKYWCNLSKQNQSFLLYAGKDTQRWRKDLLITNWKNLNLLETILFS
jgi:predicted AAA+ superfamily ATPase